jgi:hypothetical protein
MNDSFVDATPTWTWRAAAGSAVLAVLSLLFGGPATELLTGALAAVFLLTATYLLYEWGQYREKPSDGGGDDDERRTEMQAEAGGYGGNGGGL